MSLSVLDTCAGSRMFWFDSKNQNVLFGDLRSESHVLCDGRALNIRPDIRIDFRALPFDDGAFRMVVFDPPHLVRAGKKSWLALKYGVLGAHWRDDIRKGFAECFRVLEDGGILIFKWNETQVKVSELRRLADYAPMFGNKKAKAVDTHWLCFMKHPTQHIANDEVSAK